MGKKEGERRLHLQSTVTFGYLFFCQDAGEQSCDFCSGGGEIIILGALAEEAIPQLEFHLTIQVTNIQ